MVGVRAEKTTPKGIQSFKSGFKTERRHAREILYYTFSSIALAPFPAVMKRHFVGKHL